MKKYIASVASISFLAPMLAFAQAVSFNAQAGVSGLVGGIQALINVVMPIIVVIAVIVVIWGAFQLIVSGGDEEARKSGRGKILWGLVGVFIALAAWALVSIVVNTAGNFNAGQINGGNFNLF